MGFLDKYRKYSKEDENEINSLDGNEISSSLEIDNSTGERKKSNIINKILSLVLASSILLMGYNVFTIYCLSRHKFFSDDNLFTGKCFSEDIDDRDIEQYISSLEEKLGCEIIEANKDEYCLLNAIEENKNLNDFEKEEFYKCIDLILDNPYLDKEMAYSSLRNVTVHNWLFRPSGVSETTQGDYNYLNGIIRIFDKSDGNTFDHEKIHCIFTNENTINLPDYFDEGMTELLNNEYFSDDPFLELSNYPFEVAAVRMLCELTSPDVVLKAYTLGDMKFISEDLAKKCASSIEEADEALNNLDLTLQAFKSFDDNEMEKARGYFAEATVYFDKVITKLDKKDDRRVSYFYNIILLLDMFSDMPYDDYVDDLVEHGYDEKAYFSSKLKDEIAQSKEKVLTNK